MGRVKVTLNHGAIGAMLAGGLGASEVMAAAERIAAAARSGVMVEGEPGAVSLPVEVDMITTDRAHARVTIAHPSGQAVQAKHGLLTGSVG